MIDINISILGHTAVDSDSIGRFGVQGNTFNNTLGYLLDYIDALKKDGSDKLSKAHLDQLIKITSLMSSLVDTEDQVKALATRKDLTDFTDKASADIRLTNEF